MSRHRRVFAYLLLALLLPIQGLAGACAQICAVASGADSMAMQHSAASQMADAAEHEGCDQSDIGTGKCCQAHVYLGAPPSTVDASPPPAVDRTAFAARWVSFIPEEPSPPPIPSALAT